MGQLFGPFRFEQTLLANGETELTIFVTPIERGISGRIKATEIDTQADALVRYLRKSAGLDEFWMAPAITSPAKEPTGRNEARNKKRARKN